MQLSVRPGIYALPSYSLTGDLVGFLRCGLQYRYTRIGQLPSSQPVQLWFGEFIHGVLEESFRRYDESRKAQTPNPPPWPDEEIDDIIELIMRRLAARQLFPWSEVLEELGRRRAKIAVNELGPELFPLIHRAEVRLKGARKLPINDIPPDCQIRDADRYELIGVVDVVTHIQINNPKLQSNKILAAIRSQLPPDLPEKFEIIIDYKGMRRPPIKVSDNNQSFWNIYGWQIQTYAHLRQHQADSLPVAAGIILYVNELEPSSDDLLSMLLEIETKTTDILPEHKDSFFIELQRWTQQSKKGRKGQLPTIPFEFRLRRALRLVPVNAATITQSLKAFDQVVARIETCRGKEIASGTVIQTWEKNSSDENTCKACDSRTYCPDYKKEKTPSLPAVRMR
jgi:hypothetical protein